MTLSDSGVRELAYEVETFDVPATSDLTKRYALTKDRDFNLNYVIIDVLFQGATDEPTEAEKLTKMGTCNIITKGSGKWGTDLDFDDIYYRGLSRVSKGHKSYLIGDGGGDNDYHGMRFVLDAGGGLKVNNSLAWTPDLEAELQIIYGSDSGLDNSTIRLTKVGYRGDAPQGVASVENREVTFGAKGDLEKFSVNEGEKLQDAFAFLTSELNLATIQDITTFGIQNLEIRPNDNEASKKILAYVNQMVDNIDDDAEGTGQQYIYKTFDPEFQGFGYPLHNNDKVAWKAGVAEATRMYITKLQPIVVI